MSPIVPYRKIIAVCLCTIMYSAVVSSQERVLFDPERGHASYKGSVIQRLYRHAETGNAVLELSRPTRIWPDGLKEIRPTVQALLYDAGTAKFRELGMWDAIRSVDFAAGTGEPIITAHDIADTVTPEGKRYITQDRSSKSWFNYVCFRGTVHGPIFTGNFGYNLSRDGRSFATFGYAILDDRSHLSRVSSSDVARFVWHDAKRYGPYPATIGVKLIVSLEGKHVAYTIGTYDEGALFLDGAPIAPKVETHNFGFMPAEVFPYSNVYPPQVKVREDDGTENRSFFIHGYSYIEGAGTQMPYGTLCNAGTELYYLSITDGGCSLVYPGGTLGPFEECEVAPIPRGRVDPSLYLKTKNVDGKQTVRVGSFVSKSIDRGDHPMIPLASSASLYGVVSGSTCSVYENDKRVAKFPGKSPSYFRVLKDGAILAKSWVSDSVYYIFYDGTTFGPYTNIPDFLVADSNASFMAVVREGTYSKGKSTVLLNGVKYGPYPSVPDICVSPDGTEGMYITKRDEGTFVHRVGLEDARDTQGPFKAPVVGTLRYLAGNRPCFIGADFPKVSSYWVMIDGREYGPFDPFDYQNLHIEIEGGYFDILYVRDGRLVSLRQEI